MNDSDEKDAADDLLAEMSLDGHLEAFKTTQNPVDALAVLYVALKSEREVPEGVQNWFLDSLGAYLHSNDPKKSLDKALELSGMPGRSVFREHNRHHTERLLYGLVYSLCTQFNFTQKEACKLAFYRESSGKGGVGIPLDKLIQGYKPWRDRISESETNGWEFLVYWPPENANRDDYARALLFIRTFIGLPNFEVGLAEKLKSKRLWLKRKVEAMPELPTSPIT